MVISLWLFIYGVGTSLWVFPITGLDYWTAGLDRWTGGLLNNNNNNSSGPEDICSTIQRSGTYTNKAK